MYSIYPDIISKIKKKLIKLNLELITEPPESFVAKKSRFFWAFCKTSTGEKVFFKSLLKKEKGIEQRFLNEINFLQFLKKNSGHPLHNYAPVFLNSSKRPSFMHLCYKFIPGKTRRRGQKYSDKEIKKIAEMLKIINSSPINNFKFVPEKPFFNFSQYKKRVECLLNKTAINKTLEKKIGNFVNKNQDIFNQTKPALCHSDYSEANILFHKGKIKLLDWEHVHLRNPLYDLVSFWVKRKNNPREQKILVEHYLKKEKSDEVFTKLFKLALIELCLKDLMFFKDTLKILKQEKKEGRKDKITLDKAIKYSHQQTKETLVLLKKQIP